MYKDIIVKVTTVCRVFQVLPVRLIKKCSLLQNSSYFMFDIYGKYLEDKVKFTEEDYELIESLLVLKKINVS